MGWMEGEAANGEEGGAYVCKKCVFSKNIPFALPSKTLLRITVMGLLIHLLKAPLHLVPYRHSAASLKALF